MILEAHGRSKYGFLCITEGFSDGVIYRHARDVGLGILNDLAILDIEAADLAQSSGGSVVAGMELSDNGEWMAGIDC